MKYLLLLIIITGCGDNSDKQQAATDSTRADTITVGGITTITDTLWSNGSHKIIRVREERAFSTGRDAYIRKWSNGDTQFYKKQNGGVDTIIYEFKK